MKLRPPKHERTTISLALKEIILVYVCACLMNKVN